MTDRIATSIQATEVTYELHTLESIREAIEELEEEFQQQEEDYEHMSGGGRISESTDGRSVFDDIDE